MNEVDPDLLEALRALAADGPSDAPAHVEKRVREQFRRHNRRRRLAAWTLFSAAAGIVLLLVTHGAKPTSPAQIVATEESDVGFYPLPQAEALPSVENAMVVRVQLPLSSLRWMGVPVSEDGADASVQADLLLGQDGLARAVRLIE